jgi:hypothetical protein
MNNLVIKRSQQIEFRLTGSIATGKRYFATDIPNLSRNNVVVYGIEFFVAAQEATTPTGNTVTSVSTGTVVTLRDNKKQEFMYQVPQYTLIRANNAGLIVLLKPRIINLTDCYVQLTNTTSINLGESVAANIYYDLVD